MPNLDDELSWPNVPGLELAATTPMYYPVSSAALASELARLEERRNWVRAQSQITASQVISEFELGMLVKFEMVKWLECEEL